MATRIRLARHGDIHSPFYRVVVANSRSPRDGKFIEVLGTYNPLKAEPEIKIDLQKVDKWVKTGALPTETAKSVLVKAGYEFKKSNAKVSTPKTKPAKKDDNK